MSDDLRAIEAQAEIHHQYLLGLQLMVAVRQGPEVIGRLVCELVEKRRLKPRYLIEPKYKMLLFLMRFMSTSRIEKLIESVYDRGKSGEGSP